MYFKDLREIWDRWSEDNGSLLAAGVAYYGALSFFPLILTLVSGVGLALEYTHVGHSAESQLLETVSSQGSPELSEHVSTAIQELRSGAQTSGPIGLISLLLGGMAIFVQFEAAFDVIWNVDPPQPRGMLVAIRRILFQRGAAFLMLVGLGLLMLVILILGITLTAVSDLSNSVLPGSDRIWLFAQMCLPVVLNAGVFTLIYRLLPKVPVTWSEALRGGLFAGIVWEIGRQILTHFLVGTSYSSAYGIVGSFIAVMLWVYYAVTVVFLGAEYIQCVCRRCTRTTTSPDTDSGTISVRS